MRVLLVTKGLDLGGVERVVVDLAIGLSARGVDVEVAVVNSRRDRLAPVLDAAGITVHRLDGSDLIGAGAARRLTRLVNDPRFDVVHVHGPLPTVVARLATRRAQAGQHLAHPVGIAADPDPHRLARIRPPRRRHHRRVRGGRRVTSDAAPASGRS